MVNNSDYIFLGLGCGFFVVMGFSSYYFIDIVQFVKANSIFKGLKTIIWKKTQ